MRMFALSLRADDVFQILDALDSRAESYEFTAQYLNGTANADDEFRISEDCASIEEALEIAKHFRDVGASIRSQVECQ